MGRIKRITVALVDGLLPVPLATIATEVGEHAKATSLRHLDSILGQIAEREGLQTPEDLVSYVERRWDDENVRDAITDGVYRIREAFDELATECLARIVADRTIGGMKPDQEYRRAVELIAASDRQALYDLNTVTSAYLQVVDRTSGMARSRCLFEGGPKGARVEFFIYAGPGCSSDAVVRPPNLRRTLHALERGEFGRRWSGVGFVPDEDWTSRGNWSVEYVFDPSEDTQMRALHAYLSPVREGAIA